MPILPHQTHRPGTARRSLGRTASLSLVLCMTIAAIALTPARAQTVVYVDTDAAGANDGTSWADAFTFLQDALAVAQSGDEIWVAEGVYRPDQGVGITPGDREVSFSIPSGVSVYGGFQGFEIARDERSIDPMRTVLSGDLLGNDSEGWPVVDSLRSDNGIRVVRIDSISKPVILDGVSIRSGSGPSYPPAGAGAIGASHIASSIEIANAIISENGGWSIAVTGAQAEPSSISVFDTRIDAAIGLGVAASWTALHLEHVSMTATMNSGWAISYLGTATPWGRVSIGNCTILGFGGIGAINIENGNSVMWNTIVGTFGGRFSVIDVEKGSLLSVNNIFHHNRPTEFGAVLWLENADSDVVNTAFVSNDLWAGAALAISNGSASVVNSVFVENISGNDGPDFRVSRMGDGDELAVSYTLLSEPLPEWIQDGGGNIVGGMPFLDLDGPDDIPGTADDDYSIVPGAVTIDAGDVSLLPNDLLDIDRDGDTVERWPLDMAGNARIQGAAIDIGPIEVVSTTNSTIPVMAPTTEFALYPNPIGPEGQLRIEKSGVQEVADLVVLDLLGRIVLELDRQTLGDGRSVVLDTKSLPPGYYMLRDLRSGVTRSFIRTN